MRRLEINGNFLIVAHELEFVGFMEYMHSILIYLVIVPTTFVGAVRLLEAGI